MSKAAGEEDTTGDVATGVTWSDIYESPQVDRSLRRLPRLCREAVRLVWAAGRHELLVVLAIKVVNGLGLAAVLLLGKGVLDEVIAAGRSGAGAGQVLPRLLLLTVVTAGLGFLSAIGREHREILAELASRHAQSQIIDVASAVELEAYDTPAFHDRLVRAAGGGQFRPWQVVEGLTGLAGAAIGIAGIALALLALQPWLVPLVLAAAVPLLVAVARGGELMFGFRHRMTEAERRRNYLYMLLSGKDAAKELRAFGLGGFLRERYDRLYDEHMAELRKVARRRLRVSLLGNLATTVVFAGIVADLLVLALNGRVGLADAGAAAGAVFILGERLMNAVFSSGMLYESSLFIEDFTSFVGMAPEVEARRARGPAPGRLPAPPGRGRQLHLPERHHPGRDRRVHGDRGRRDRRPGRRERLGQDHPGQAAVPAVPAPRRPGAVGRGRHRRRRPRRAAPVGGRHLPGLPPLLTGRRREHRHGPPPANR
jgi:ATP-binding cassette, subfamily B, bacterial